MSTHSSPLYAARRRAAPLPAPPSATAIDKVNGTRVESADPTAPASPTRYEVQQFTICQGWLNTWTVSEGNGAPAPETFSSKEEAQTEIDELLSDVQDEIAIGERDPEHGYDASEFRVVATASQGEAS